MGSPSSEACSGHNLTRSSSKDGVENGSVRVKFLCSFGGSIMPRPQDGKLRYVGGETRIVSVPRNVCHEELMRRMRELYDEVTVMKYQQPEEDLDALVSLVNDEDVVNMMEEYDKLGSGDGFTKLRIFLFTRFDEDVDPHFVDGDGDRRYVDALNNVSDASDYWRLNWNDSPRMSSVEDMYAADPCIPVVQEGIYFNQRNCEMLPCYGNHHLLSPRYNSNQFPTGHRYGDAESPWSPVFCSPRHHGYGDLPSPTSSARYNMPYGEYPDNKMTGDFRWPQAVQRPPFEQMPRYPENVVWVPTRNVTSHQAGFPANILQGTNVFEGQSGCEHYHMAFQRNRPEAGNASPVNGFEQNLSPSAGCHPDHEQERMIHDHLKFQVEEQVTSDFDRFNDKYMVDNTAITSPVTNDNLTIGHQLPSNCAIPHEHLQYVQPGTALPLQATNIPSMAGRSCNGSPVPEDRPAYYANLPRDHAAENNYHIPHRHAPLDVLPRNIQTIVHGNREPNHNGDVNQGYSRMVGNEPSCPGFVNCSENWTDSSQKVVGLDASAMLDYPNGNTLILNTRAADKVTGRPPLAPSRSVVTNLDTVVEEAARPSSIPLDESLGFVATSICEVERRENPSLVGGEEGVFHAKGKETILALVEVNIVQGDSCQKQNVGHAEPETVSNEAVHGNCLKPKNKCPEIIEQDAEASANCADVNSETKAALSKEANCADVNSETKAGLSKEANCADVNSERKAVLSKEEVTGKLQNEPDAQLLQPSEEKEAPANEIENKDWQLETEWNSDNENISKIEPTKAEEEAVARGLQTIKTADLEEIRELGSGTYGAVYHGKWKGSDVAIKRIKASCFAGKPSERERLIADFWNEALLLSSLHHPNVVSFYGIVRDGPNGTLATVTEFMINGSLKQFLKKKDRTIDRRKRLIIAMDAAFGMEYLHGKNIVHFDLKCENLLVNMRDPQRPICKIGDLGLSKVKQRTLVSGGIRGTLPWMAPELLNGKNNMVSEKIDVYSFGVVMWELLTGDEPYADMHCASIIGGIVNNTLRPQIPTWCDPEWKALMESCWASDPAERPSFSEISQKLRSMATATNIK